MTGVDNEIATGNILPMTIHGNRGVKEVVVPNTQIGFWKRINAAHHVKYGQLSRRSEPVSKRRGANYKKGEAECNPERMCHWANGLSESSSEAEVVAWAGTLWLAYFAFTRTVAEGEMPPAFTAVIR